MIDKSLAIVFSDRLTSAIQECHKLNYIPSRLETMLTMKPAVSVAVQMVTAPEIQDGLKTLRSLNRLDLSIEQIMLEPEFELLFSKPHRDAAHWRLLQVNINASRTIIK
jgi:hypothetical protein